MRKEYSPNIIKEQNTIPSVITILPTFGGAGILLIDVYEKRVFKSV